MSDNVTVHMITTGLHCPSCSMLVKMELEEVPGVSDVVVDHVTGATTVTFDPDSATTDDLIGAVVAAGYSAELAD
jgi:copper chaperone CopZ